MQERSSRQLSCDSAAPPRQEGTIGSKPIAIPPGGIPVIALTRDFAVVDKPAWMLSVPGKGPEKADCVAARVAAMFPDARGPLIAHRLDMETSGLMVLGLTEAAQRDLSGQFEGRVVEKSYTALLAGGQPLGQTSGVVALPLRADLDNRPVQIVDAERGRPSETRWQVLAHEVDRLRVRFEPLTGRTHQIRVHAAVGLGRPIIGDSLYGGEPAERLMLHATELSFLEPGTRRRVRFVSPVPF